MGRHCWHCVWVMFGVDPELNDYALSYPDPDMLYRSEPCAGCGAEVFTGDGHPVRDIKPGSLL